jgi:hypothetical protein
LCCWKEFSSFWAEDPKKKNFFFLKRALVLKKNWHSHFQFTSHHKRAHGLRKKKLYGERTVQTLTGKI